MAKQKSLQSAFFLFDETIRLSNVDDDVGKAPLREAREKVVAAVRAGLTAKYKDREESKPTFTDTVQGSYAIATGIEPTGQRDYDVDVALTFNIDHTDARWADPSVIKGEVEDALNSQSIEGATVEMMRPCIRVSFPAKRLHVDLAIYAVGGSNQHLARGFRGSSADKKQWERAEPGLLAERLRPSHSNSEHRDQYRRVVRALKRWKDINFRERGDSAPPGVGLTMLVRDGFRPAFKADGKPNDLAALLDVVKAAIGRFTPVWDDETGSCTYRLVATLPAEPYNDVFAKLSANQMSQFKAKLEALRDTLQSATDARDPADAADLLRTKCFGDDFPEVESAAAKQGPAVVGVSHSA